jgi:Acetyltransferase (GNAT) domain
MPPEDAAPASDRRPTVRAKAGLSIDVRRTIHEVNRDLWDRCLGTAGACSWDAMAMAERVFSGQPKPEHNWRFLYVIVTEPSGEPVLATFFTTALCKDDMLMRPEVSRAVEARRAGDPYFLTSLVVSMGSMLSEGNHLYLDRSGPWKAALEMALGVATEEYESTQAAVLLLRDLPSGDAEMDGFALDAGFVKVPMLDSHHLAIDWTTEEGYLAGVGGRSRRRKQLREIMAAGESYRVDVHAGRPLPPDEVAHLYQLYRNVAERKLKLNVFSLPEELIPEMLASPAWEIVTLLLDPERGGPESGAPVAWFAAHKNGGHYAPFVCGLDYRYVVSQGAYRQMLYQIVKRATALGARSVHLGMDADTEKLRFGTAMQGNCVYVQARDHFSGALLQEIVAEVGVARPEEPQALAS